MRSGRSLWDEMLSSFPELQQAQTVEEQGQAENLLTQAIGRLFAVAEAYPELRATEHRRLMLVTDALRARNPLRDLVREAVPGGVDVIYLRDAGGSTDDLALTTAIIAMAHSLGITVVAEGVEKEGQYAILRERGCDLAQGYWIGHPIDATAFAAFLG